jgi:hypothetical protein
MSQEKVTQGNINARNVILKCTPPGLMVLDEEAIAAATAANRKAQDESWEKDHPPADNWREELDELERRLRGYSSEADCQVHAEREEAKHKAIVGAIENEIAYVQSLLATPGLDLCIPRQRGREPKPGCGCDGCLFDKRIRVLGSRLDHAKQKQRIVIRECGDLVRRARELAPLIPRYRELAAKAEKIDTARKVARGLIDGKPRRMHEESIQGNERLFQAHHPALTWETKAAR